MCDKEDPGGGCRSSRGGHALFWVLDAAGQAVWLGCLTGLLLSSPTWEGAICLLCAVAVYPTPQAASSVVARSGPLLAYRASLRAIHTPLEVRAELGQASGAFHRRDTASSLARGVSI